MHVKLKGVGLRLNVMSMEPGGPVRVAGEAPVSKRLVETPAGIV